MVPTLTHKNRTLYADLASLLTGLEEAVLTADCSSTTLTVKNIDGFAVNQILLVGELGQEGSEIVKTHASSAPSGTTITLTASLAFSHPAGTKVYRIEFNQIEWNYCATLTGVKSVLATSDIQADQRVQSYLDTSQTTGYYFARFKNSITTTYGSYSDGIPYGGYVSTTAGSAIRYALSRNGMDGYDTTITKEFCFEEINDCFNEVQGAQLRWPEHASYDYLLGELSAGTPTVTLPTDIYDNDSNKSIIGVRIADGDNLNYVDPIQFEESYKDGETRTQVATQQTAGNTTLVVDDASDFDSAGSLSYYVSGTLYTITYTAVNKTTNTFSGIPASGTGAITVTTPVDTYIYQNAVLGTPTVFTVRNGVLEFDPIPDATIYQNNVYLDYWKVATAVDTEGDAIDVQRYDMVRYWLTWKVRMQKRNEGALDLNDGYYAKYKERLNQAVRNKPRNIKYPFRPKINRIRYN